MSKIDGMGCDSVGRHQGAGRALPEGHEGTDPLVRHVVAGQAEAEGARRPGQREGGWGAPVQRGIDGGDIQNINKKCSKH